MKNIVQVARTTDLLSLLGIYTSQYKKLDFLKSYANLSKDTQKLILLNNLAFY